MNPRLWNFLSDKRTQRAGLLIGLWIPAIVVLLVVREVLLPFLLAFALAYVIAPVVKRISAVTVKNRHLPRWGSVLLLYALMALTFWIAGRVFVPQLYKEVRRLVTDATEVFHQLSDENIAKKATQLEAWVEENDLPIHIITAEDDEKEPELKGGDIVNVNVVAIAQDLIRTAKDFVKTEAFHAASQVKVIVGTLFKGFFSVFLVLMLTAFIVGDLERIAAFFFTITPVRDRAALKDLFGRIDHGLSGVVRGQITICIINGVLTLIGLLILKVKFAFLLAIMAATFSLIPIFGSILSTIPIVIVGLSSGLSTALLAVLWIVFIHALEANLLNPKIMGDAAKIHPVLIVLALVVGEHFYGLSGALFAVPLMSIALTVWEAARTRAMVLDHEINAHEDRSHEHTLMELLTPKKTPPPPRARRSDGG